MVYNTGTSYTIKLNTMDERLNGSTFECYMVADTVDGGQIVWGILDEPICLDGLEYTMVKMNSEEMLCDVAWKVKR